MKLSDNSTSCEVVRDRDFSSLGYVDSTHPDTLVFADSDKYLQLAIANSNISCIITTKLLSEIVPVTSGLLIADAPRKIFYDIHSELINQSKYLMPFKPNIGSGCQIHRSAIVGKGCRIGDNVKIGEYAVIRDNVWIDSNVTIEAGVKLGVDGILYSSDKL